MCSITITAKDHDHDNHHLSCDGPYVIYQPNGGVRVINVTETGVVKDTVYAALPDDFTLHVADHKGNYRLYKRQPTFELYKQHFVHRI